MRKEERNVCMHTTAWLPVVVILLFCSTSICFGFAHIQAIQYTLYSSDAFYKDGGDGTFFLDEDHSSDPQVIGNILLEGDNEYRYEIRGGSITLTPSVILEDQSYDFFPEFGNAKIAQGYFQRGATLTMSGYLTTVNGGQVLTQYGTLLEATIVDNFYAVEEMWCPDFLDLQMQFHVTGGELFTGAQAGYVFSKDFVADITLRFCTEGGGELNDFADDIGYASPSVVQINSNGDYPVPEPASLLLFGLAGLFIRKNKK